MGDVRTTLETMPGTIWGASLLSILLATTTLADTGDIKRKKATRDAMLGPIIATGKTYVMHADKNMATMQNGKPVCASFMSIEERNEKIGQANQAHTDLANERDEALRALTKKHMRDNQAAIKERGRLSEALRQKYIREQLSPQEYKAQVADLQKSGEARVRQQMQDREALQERYGKKINDAVSASQNLDKSMGSNALSLSLLHTPSSPNTLILPMSGNQLEDGFVSELNTKLQPFLKTCTGTPSMVYTHHYYADAYRYGDGDQSIVSFRYNLEGNELKLIKCNTPSCRAVMATQGRSSDPARNPDLTLAGFIASNREKARLAGEYRKDFYDAAKRKKGIVYYYDEFWQPYLALDGGEVVRRIFDGDFKGFKDTIEFKMFFSSYAERFTVKCKKEVKGIKIYPIHSRNYVGTEYHMDGSQTRTYENTTIDVPIDTRFVPAWGNYYPEVKKAYFSNMLSDMANKNGPDIRQIENWADLFKAGEELANRTMPEAVLAINFLDKHQCNSATARQMTENLSRAAKGQPSAQNDGSQFAGAALESDPPTNGGVVPSVRSEQKKTPVAVKQVKPATPITTNQQPATVNVTRPDSRPNLQLEPASRLVTTAPSARPETKPKTRKQVLETNKRMQNALQKQQQAYADAMKIFQQQMRTAKTQEERTTLQKTFMEQQTRASQKLRERLQK